MADSIEDSVCCPVCKEIFQEPKFLKCGHSICTNCVNRIWNGCSLKCPMCRRGFVLEIGSTLPTNLGLRDLVAALGPGDHEGLTCSTEGCHWRAMGSSLDSLWSCVPCQKLFCSTCVVRDHRKHEPIQSYQTFRSDGSETLSSALQTLQPSKSSFERIRTKLRPAIQAIERTAMQQGGPVIQDVTTGNICREAKDMMESIEHKLTSLSDVMDETEDTSSQSDEALVAVASGSHDSGGPAFVPITYEVIKEKLDVIAELKQELPATLPILDQLTCKLDEVASVIRHSEREHEQQIQQLLTSKDDPEIFDEIEETVENDAVADDDEDDDDDLMSSESFVAEPTITRSRAARERNFTAPTGPSPVAAAKSTSDEHLFDQRMRVGQIPSIRSRDVPAERRTVSTSRLNCVGTTSTLTDQMIAFDGLPDHLATISGSIGSRYRISAPRPHVAQVAQQLLEQGFLRSSHISAANSDGNIASNNNSNPSSNNTSGIKDSDGVAEQQSVVAATLEASTPSCMTAELLNTPAWKSVLEANHPLEEPGSNNSEVPSDDNDEYHDASSGNVELRPLGAVCLQPKFPFVPEPLKESFAQQQHHHGLSLLGDDSIGDDNYDDLIEGPPLNPCFRRERTSVSSQHYPFFAASGAVLQQGSDEEQQEDLLQQPQYVAKDLVPQGIEPLIEPRTHQSSEHHTTSTTTAAVSCRRIDSPCRLVDSTTGSTTIAGCAVAPECGRLSPTKHSSCHSGGQKRTYNHFQVDLGNNDNRASGSESKTVTSSWKYNEVRPLSEGMLPQNEPQYPPLCH